MKKAAPKELRKIQKQLQETFNEPDLYFLECHCIDLNNEKFDTNNCKKCFAYKKFAAKYPNHFPKYEK